MENNHRFWNTQPVEVGEGNDIIKHPNKILTEPLKLPEGFVFDNISDYKEISKFLSENYVEDTSEQFRLLYSEQFLEYMINNPKYKTEYSLGLRFNNKLVGYVFARETVLSIDGKVNSVASVDFLCVSKELRGKRISPVLIKEITRRCNCNGIYQAIFTSGTNFFFKIAESNYFHRPLNAKRLVSSGFMADTTPIDIPKLREGTVKASENDVDKMFESYNTYSTLYKMHQKMDKNEFIHNFLYPNDAVSTFVHYEKGEVKSFGSFFTLETFCIQKKMKLRIAYLYYTCGENIKEMVSDLLYFANAEKCDVFNCIDVANSTEFIDSLGFCSGTGVLNYYLYNWKAITVDKKEVFFYLQ